MALQQTLKVVVQNPGHPTWQEVSPYSLEAGKDNRHLRALKSPVPWTGISAWFKPWLVADCSFSNCFPECVETAFLCPPRRWDAPTFSYMLVATPSWLSYHFLCPVGALYPVRISQFTTRCLPL